MSNSDVARLASNCNAFAGLTDILGEERFEFETILFSCTCSFSCCTPTSARSGYFGLGVASGLTSSTRASSPKNACYRCQFLSSIRAGGSTPAAIYQFHTHDCILPYLLASYTSCTWLWIDIRSFRCCAACCHHPRQRLLPTRTN